MNVVVSKIQSSVRQFVDDAHSVFVVPSRAQQELLKGFLALLTIPFIVSAFSAPSLTSLFVALGSFLVFFTRALPVFFMRETWGWFHPLVFSSLFWICRSIPESALEFFSLLRFGSETLLMDGHDALVGWTPDALHLLSLYGSLLTVLAMFCYYGGFFYGPQIGFLRVRFHAPKNIGMKVFLVTMFSASIFLYFIYERGGLNEHLLSWQVGRHQALAGEGHFLHLISLASIACLIWLTVDAQAITKLSFWALTMTSLGMKFLSTGSRSQVIYWFFMGLLVWMFGRKEVKPLKVFVVLVFSIVMLGVLGSFRGAVIWRGEVDWERLTDLPTAFESVFGTSDSEGELVTRGGRQNGLLPVLAYVPKEEPFLWGKSYLSILTTPIPRALWDEKPRTIGALVSETFFDYNTNFAIPPGAVGEAYWNFYIPGIIVIFFLYGAFHRSLSRWYTFHAHDRTAALFYVMTLFIFSAPDGLSIINWMFVIVPTVIILKLFNLVSFTSHASSR